MNLFRQIASNLVKGPVPGDAAGGGSGGGSETKSESDAALVRRSQEGDYRAFDDLVTTIKSQLPDLKVEIVPGTPPLNRAAPLDITRAKEMLGWEPQFTLEEAFADYVADLRAQMG